MKWSLVVAVFKVESFIKFALLKIYICIEVFNKSVPIANVKIILVYGNGF